ncbi:MAG TPA: type II secretion system protein GspM [Brevundimonas sp.]|nr:type II secretion system protein GspM [Brevundimonas sp.]
MIVAVVRARALPAVERANVWLAGRSERERLLLIVLALLGIAAVGWYGIVQPLLTARQTAFARIELYEGLQARLRAAPAGVATVPGAALPPGPLDEAIRQAAAAQALGAEVAGDAERTGVTIANARFDSVVPFVRALESGGVIVDDLRMETAGQPGLINLTLTATRP